MNRELQRRARRNEDLQSARVNDIPVLRGFFATVTTVGAGTATVSWRGSTDLPARTGSTYTPAPGDWVLCVLGDKGQLTIIDRYA